MPEDRNGKLLQPSRTSDSKKNKKKHKKKRNKATSSTSPPESTETPQAVSLPSETSPVSLLSPQSPAQPQAQLPLRATSKKDIERHAGSSQRSKKHPKDSSALLTANNKPIGGGELSSQARESLRWEGVLEDPQAEEKRLELYRANRRQRYITQRDNLKKETQGALRQSFPTHSKEKNDESAKGVVTAFEHRLKQRSK